MSGPASRAEFPLTAWSLVLNAGASPASSPALEDLCRAYWPPLYSFLRRQGHSPRDAEDLVQGFLARLLGRQDFGPFKGSALRTTIPPPAVVLNSAGWRDGSSTRISRSSLTDLASNFRVLWPTGCQSPHPR